MNHRYYSVMRPVSPGTYPKNGCVAVHNYCHPQHVETIDRTAWGFVEYDRMLTDDETKSYELVSEDCRTWYSVLVTIRDNGCGKISAKLASTRKQIGKPDDREWQGANSNYHVKWFPSREAAESYIDDIS